MKNNKTNVFLLHYKTYYSIARERELDITISCRRIQLHFRTRSNHWHFRDSCEAIFD